MEEIKKTWIEEIKETWYNIPNSVKFWNGLILLVLIISGVMGIDLLIVEWAIMSIFAFVLWIDSLGDEDKLDKHLWLWFTPLVWGLCVVGLIIYGCIKFYENIISKFNDWLNKQNKI